MISSLDGAWINGAELAIKVESKTDSISRLLMHAIQHKLIQRKTSGHNVFYRLTAGSIPAKRLPPAIRRVSHVTKPVVTPKEVTNFGRINSIFAFQPQM